MHALNDPPRLGHSPRFLVVTVMGALRLDLRLNLNQTMYAWLRRRADSGLAALADKGSTPRGAAPLGDQSARSDLNAARISVANSSGSSQAAKWPPFSTSLK
jgi:hypothetical protein